jgi:hypothetical protein
MTGYHGSLTLELLLSGERIIMRSQGVGYRSIFHEGTDDLFSRDLTEFPKSLKLAESTPSEHAGLVALTESE